MSNGAGQMISCPAGYSNGLGTAPPNLWNVQKWWAGSKEGLGSVYIAYFADGQVIELNCVITFADYPQTCNYPGVNTQTCLYRLDWG